jgi:hypothetical protein
MNFLRSNLPKALLVALLICTAMGTILMLKSQSGNGHIYTITVTSFNHQETYTTNKIISRIDNCVTFQNILGQKQTVCSENLSITEY